MAGLAILPNGVVIGVNFSWRSYGLWQTANGRGGMVECRKYSDRLQQLTAGDADDGLRLQAHHSAWTTGLFSGEPAAAHEHCRQGRRLYDPERHRHHRLLYGGHDPGVCARYMGAQAYWLLGLARYRISHGSRGVGVGRTDRSSVQLGHRSRHERHASPRSGRAGSGAAADRGGRGASRRSTTRARDRTADFCAVV